MFKRLLYRFFAWLIDIEGHDAHILKELDKLDKDK